MKYLMLVCVDPEYTPGADNGSPETDDWAATMDAKGIRLIGDRTRPGSAATTVRVRNREVLVTDGPYTETKDLIAGFDVLECEDLDQAIEVAAKHPMAWAGVIELRPVWPWGED
ncbi:YciI family protein [Actinoplanes utahensis]|uniref:Transcription initiation protein n=1 Tax=Actinoplanes utahensis TaxID=1869 RepID=A0A0A6UPN7_ACTUT|nr:YciI family protein [Actinoplanes utahensis]KHD78110.1 transcription initiation protein [Actinoplanes utahensis]GIF30571.1 transcription initiation protein [Actinoplanes utahensis]